MSKNPCSHRLDVAQMALVLQKIIPRLRKLSSSSSVSQQLNCSSSAVHEMGTRPTNASSDLIEEEEEDEEVFVDTTDEVKETSANDTIKEVTIKPHRPMPSHSPPSLIAPMSHSNSSFNKETKDGKLVDANVSQSEEEALDKVTVSDILVSSFKPDDERPHSVAVVTSESSCITARLDSTYSLADYDNMGKICQNRLSLAVLKVYIQWNINRNINFLSKLSNDY